MWLCSGSQSDSKSRASASSARSVGCIEYSVGKIVSPICIVTPRASAKSQIILTPIGRALPITRVAASALAAKGNRAAKEDRHLPARIINYRGRILDRGLIGGASIRCDCTQGHLVLCTNIIDVLHTRRQWPIAAERRLGAGIPRTLFARILPGRAVVGGPLPASRPSKS